MKYSMVGIFGVFCFICNRSIFWFKSYMQKGVKRNQDGHSVLITKKHYMSLTGHIPLKTVRAGAQKAQRCSISSGKGRKKAEEKGIRILGAYVTVTEHDYFIIFEANDYSAAVEFFLPARTKSDWEDRTCANHGRVVKDNAKIKDNLHSFNLQKKRDKSIQHNRH